MIVPLTVACIISASSTFGVPADVMVGILKTEGGTVGQCVTHSNGREDCGPFQINSETWIKPLSKIHFEGNQKLTRKMLKDHGCYNAHIAAWILRQSIDDAGGNVLKGVTYYHHPKNKYFQSKYKERFTEKYKSLFMSEK